MLTNWKTTLAGIGTILGALGDIAHGVSTGNFSNISIDIGLIAGAVGLILAADAKKTGSN